MVAGEVGRGVSLSVAMGKAPAVFDAPYRALVSTGEEAGALPVCLERYQDYVDLRQKTGAQVSKAMIYPIALLITLSAVLTFLFIAVIPNFVSMYRELGSALPMPTQVLMAVEERFPFIAIGIAGSSLPFGSSTGFGPRHPKGPSRATRRFSPSRCSGISGGRRRRRPRRACSRF